MINRDKFDALEGVWADKGLLSHLAIGLITFGLTLGVETGMAYSQQPSPVALGILVVCSGSVFLGGLLGIFALVKWGKYKKLRATLFDDQRLIADETILLSSDGSQLRIDHLTPSSSGGPVLPPETGS